MRDGVGGERLPPEIRQPRSDAELEAVFDLCDVAFPETPRDFFVRSLRSDPAWEAWQTRILVEGGKIVSSVQIFVREISLHDRWVRCGGIGNVATHPSARGRGYASALMRDALELIRQRGYPVSVLFTEIHGFYSRFGYRTLPMKRALLSWKNEAVVSKQGVREPREADWPCIRALHEQYALAHPILVRREERRWASIDQTAISNRPRWLVHEGERGVDAYLRFDQIEGTWRVTEYCVPPAKLEILDDLLYFVFRQSGFQELIVDSLDAEGVLRRSRFFSREEPLDELMFAVVNAERLAEEGGFAGPEEALDYVRSLEVRGVDFWRTDFF